MEEEEEDSHMCLRCKTIVVGLDQYVEHRKQGCQVTWSWLHSDEISKLFSWDFLCKIWFPIRFRHLEGKETKSIENTESWHLSLMYSQHLKITLGSMFIGLKWTCDLCTCLLVTALQDSRVCIQAEKAVLSHLLIKWAECSCKLATTILSGQESYSPVQVYYKQSMVRGHLVRMTEVKWLWGRTLPGICWVPVQYSVAVPHGLCHNYRCHCGQGFSIQRTDSRFS